MNKDTTVYRIMDLDETDRPRERLANYGPGALSNRELLAILLRTGIPGENAVQLGARLLQELGGLSGLHKADYAVVCQMRGIGPAKAAQIKAAIELGRRLSAAQPEERPAIHSPGDAAELVLYEMSALEQEELRVMHLDVRNRVNAIVPVYRGTTNSSHVRVGELFRDAVRRNSVSIILVHNHPSGDPTPSPDDLAVTRQILEAGRILDIKVLDHLVIGDSRWVSLKQRGMEFH